MKIDNWKKREFFLLLFWAVIGLIIMVTVMSLVGCGSSKSNFRQEASVEENLNRTHMIVLLFAKKQPKQKRRNLLNNQRK